MINYVENVKMNSITALTLTPTINRVPNINKNWKVVFSVCILMGARNLHIVVTVVLPVSQFSLC